jgi:CzcA family heavy metal efflux pump
MRGLVNICLQYRFLVIALAVAMVFFGFTRINKMPVDVFPEFAPPRVEIQTESPGMSTVEVEELITIPLEEVFSGTPGLDDMRSKSVPGLSSILLIFEPGTDGWLARQLVDERLALAIRNVPQGVIPYMLQPLSSTSRALKIGLTSEEIDLIELSAIAFWKIRPALMAAPGVANVAMWGERLQQFQVQVDPERLRAYDLSLDQVLEVTADALEVGILEYSNSAVPGTGGWIDTPQQRLGVQHVLPINWPEELAQVTVKLHDGEPVLLSDLGQVVEDHPPLIGDAVINDGEGLMLIVEKFPWGNTLEVTRAVEEALEKIRPGLSGIEIDTEIFRPATFVEMSMDNLRQALILSGVLVIVVIFAFLWEWRIAVISVTIIPFAIMAALTTMSVQGATLNVMVLAALVIAIDAIVDDAVVGVENTMRRLRQLRSEGSTKPIKDIVLEGALEVRNTIVYGSLSQVVALLPLFFMAGLSGAFFQPLARAYVMVCLVSPLIALTVTPAMVLILLKNAPTKGRESPIALRLRRVYGRALSWTLDRPALAYVTVAVLLVSGVAVFPLLGQELLPEFKERDFLMHWLTKPGTSHPEMYRITQQASRELRQIPGVRNFGAHIGRALMADEVVGIYFTENWVSIDPNVDYDATVTAIQETVDGYPGLLRDVQTYLKERIREVLTGSSEAIVVRIYGPELDVLRSKAEEVRDGLAEIDGIVDLHVELHIDIPQIEIEVDLAKAARYGLKPGDVRRAAAAMLASIEVGDIYRAGRAYDVAVWSMPENRNSLTGLRELLIDTPSGDYVRLEDVAEVRVVATPNVIEHEGLARRLDVSANVRGRDLGSVTRDVERVLQEIEFPLEYHPEIIGEYAERQDAQQRIVIAGIVAVIGIYFLLYTSFENWRLTTLAIVTLPQAVVGGVLAVFFVGGGTMSLGSLVGLLTILDNAVRNCIMLFSHYQHLEEEEGETFGRQLVLRGSMERITPMAMLGLTAGLALLPMLLAGNVPGNEIQYPMAIVILGGLFTSEVLNLFVVPVLYLRFGKSRRERRALESNVSA